MSNPTEEDLNEYENVVADVCHKRKVYPRNCASYLSKTIKAEIKSLKTSVVELPQPENKLQSVNISEVSDVFKARLTEALTSKNDQNGLAEFAENVDGLSQKTRDMSTVLKQIQNEDKDKITVVLKQGANI